MFSLEDCYNEHMNPTVAQAKEIMERGWKAREDLQFDDAETLLNQAKSIFEELGDWYNVTECLNHLSYNEKLRAQHHTSAGISFVNQSMEISHTHTTKQQSVLRAQVSLLIAQGSYERALQIAKKLFESYSKPANKADVLNHVALCELRTGHLDNAKASLTLAEKLLEEGWEEVTEPHRSIWKVSLLLTKSMTLYNSSDIADAKIVAKTALDLATHNNLKTRISQAQNLLDLLDTQE
jgi:tetratricopeptide (TPR) repeat protein